jgi:murein DD-endopeptidase MepM/ murein hydrolase activator NlpD
VLGALVVVNLYVFVWDKQTSVGAIKREADRATPTAMLPSRPLEEAGVRPGSAVPAVPKAAATSPLRGAGVSGSGGGSGGVAAPIGPPGVIEGRVGKSDTLGRVLKKSGLTAAEADEVIRALSGVFDFKTMRAGQIYRIERGPDGRVKTFELVVSKVQTVRAERSAAGTLVGKAESSQTRIEVKSVGGRIDSSLYAAIKASGESPALVDFFVDVFAYDLDFYNDTHDGDTFRVVVEKEVHDTGQSGPGASELVRYRRILAAEYAGKAGTFRTFWFSPRQSPSATATAARPLSGGPGGPGGGARDPFGDSHERAGDGYFTETGESSEKTLLKTPLKFERVSSGFDRARMHPVLHSVRAHLGIDYAAPAGTPVWAAASGVITQRGDAGGAGNLVVLRHDGGIETAYMHLSKFAQGQKIGQRVTAKTVIGYVGATGLATGPHLHFGVKQDGNYIDPSKLAPVRARALAGKDAAAFRAESAKRLAELAAIPVAKPAT